MTAVFGGITSVTGAVLGSLWIVGIPRLLGTEYALFSSGFAVVLVLLLLPGALAKETVITPISSGYPLGVFAIIPDGSGGLSSSNIGGTWGPSAVKVRRLVHLTFGSNPPPTTTTTSSTTSTTTSTTTTTTTMPGTTTTTAPPSGNVAPDTSARAGRRGDRGIALHLRRHGDRRRIREPGADGGAQRHNQQWLQANGTFGPTFAQFDATLSQPNAASTGWTWTRTLPAGSYYVQSKAVDNTSTNETATPWVAFSVS